MKAPKGNSLPACAVLLAGGRGTRFWPRSRTRLPKQLLNIVGQETMLRQTVERIRPLFAAKNLWVVTNSEQAARVRRELPFLPAGQILSEPIGRNTAAAIGLAAVHLAHAHGDALMAVLPADHYIARAARYRRLVRAALALARHPGNLVVMGIPPTRPETGFGYIERAGSAGRPGSLPAYAVRRFAEKPSLGLARGYVHSRRYFWNAGMFFWRVSTFLDSLKRFLPVTHAALMGLAETIGTRRYGQTLAHIYRRLENISVDYAVMEPATRGKSHAVFVLPAEVGWSDIGTWAAVHELLARVPGQNVSAGKSYALDASGNFFWCPKKFVAAVGVRDLIVVDTADALLVCARERAQDVAKVVKWLEQQKLRNLL
jgi:mannose-1-phosphate guanylyltransferase